MYRYAAQTRVNNVKSTKARSRILLILFILLLAIAIGMSVLATTAISFRNKTGEQLSQRMANCVSQALGVVNRMESVTNSGTSQQLGYVRSYVYAMKQLNEMSIALRGEAGRYAPDEAFKTLEDDIKNYEGIIQSAKTSTLDARTMLNQHLTALQGFVSGKLVSE